MSDGPVGGQRKIRVAVIFGGRSTEHGVSALSASSVLAALAGSDEIEVVPVGITRRGQWMLTSGDPKELAQSGREMPEVLTGTEVVLPADAQTRGLLAVRPEEGVVAALSDVDVVFPCAARRLWRGRHDPGAAGDGRHPVRRGRCARVRGRHGQGVCEEAARRRGAAQRPVRGAAAAREDAE
nr:hypothetical protein [Fodinicola feengrottensis]